MESNSVAYVVQPPTLHSYWTKRIIKGMEQEANHKRILLCQFESISSFLRDKRQKCSHVLLIGHSTQWFFQAADILRNHSVEPIFVSAYRPQDERYNSVCFSMPGAIEEMVTYLSADGKQRIAFVGYNPDSPADMAKAAAFLRIAQTKNCLESELFPCNNMSVSKCVEDVVAQINRFDAVMCANDPVAIVTMGILQGRGIRVPADVYVTGSGNLRLTKLFEFPITSIDFDYVLLGQWAVRLFLQIHQEEPDIFHHVLLPCKVIVRASTNHFSPIIVKNSQKATIPDEVNVYYSDEMIAKLNEMEELLQECDGWDYQIMEMILTGKTFKEIAEKLHFTERTIKYRVKTLCEKANVRTKRELTMLLQSYRHVQ